MARVKRIVTFFVDTYSKWLDDRANRMAAAVAYYTLFSIAPLLFLLTSLTASVAERFLGDIAVQKDLNLFLSEILPADLADYLIDLVGSTAESATFSSSLPIISIISVVAILWGASNVFTYLHEALNTMWGLKPLAGSGIFATVRRRLVAFAIVLIAGVLLIGYVIVISVVSVALPLLKDLASELEFAARILESIPDSGLISIFQFVSLFIIATLLFSALYKILPDVEITWRDVFIGAAFTSLLFGIGTSLLSVYFSFYSSSLYGAAGSLVVLLLWFYYSAQIFMYGAEFTYMYATRYGSQIVPAEGAVQAGTSTEFDGDEHDSAGSNHINDTAS